MTDLNITLPETMISDAVEGVVEDVCAGIALNVTMKGSLAKYPGCTHWHFKQGKEAGVLEATWWPSRNQTQPARLWLSVHGNRQAAWIEDLMPELKLLIEARLASVSDA